MTPEVNPSPNPNPTATISAGYQQIQDIFKSVLDAAASAPWWVWASIAALLLMRNNDE